MNPVLNQLGTTFVWLCLFAPLIFLGLFMAIDPLSFRARFHDLAEALREALHRFERQLHNTWQEPIYPSAPVAPSQTADAVVRFAGLATFAVSLLGLWEVLH
jgi:hypothetical protein